MPICVDIDWLKTLFSEVGFSVAEGWSMVGDGRDKLAKAEPYKGTAPMK
jgi:hypothetical protein